MILLYREQSQNTIADQHQHERIEYISIEEWLLLVHFNEKDIQTMTFEEISRRIAALKSIVDAPHYSFNWDLKNDPKFKQYLTSVYETTLNGHASRKIFLLESYLKDCVVQ